MQQQSGNALFIILIGVALFGMLSYAITQSSRTNMENTSDRFVSKASPEMTQVLVTEFVKQASQITGTIKDHYMTGYDGQIQFTEDAENLSGTTYLSDQTTGTGKTVGFYTAGIGGTEKITPSMDLRTTGSSGWFVVYNSRLTVDGVDVGTSAGDMFLRMRHLTYEACMTINEHLHGVRDRGYSSGSWGDTQARYDGYYGNTHLSGSFLTQTNIKYLPGCNGNDKWSYTYFELIEAY